MSKNKADFPMVDIVLHSAYPHQNRGIIAKQDIKENEMVMFVPHEMIVTYEIACATKLA